MTRGLHQGYALSPLLSNVFFAAILFVKPVIERFSEGSDKLVDLAHHQEQPATVDPKTALECARRAIWRMLYADDA